MFVWRGFFDLFGVSQLVYFFAVLLVLLNFFEYKRRQKIIRRKTNIGLSLYIIFGFILVLFSFISKGPILTAMGFVSLYLNLLIWTYSLIPIDERSGYANNYINIFVASMAINAGVSIYQYFIDPSFFGMVTNMYGDADTMSMENVTRRTVGLMGSPQSFSASCGISLFVASVVKNKWFRLGSVVLILIGGLLSGSRAFGVFMIFWFLYLFFKLDKSQKAIAIIIIIPVLVYVGIFLYSIFEENETIMRNFAFDRWAASSIFFSSFKHFEWYDYIFGKGFGLEGWNANTGKLSFDYSSTESALLSIVYKTGVINAFLFLIGYITIYFKSLRNSFCRFLMIPMFINLCVTPAFIGFAYSYLAWGTLLMIQHRSLGSNK